ncbi:MAG TPA: KUP/HAK/KT family potassium transporter [Polyangiaceae bacterium]|nr:KUP/HAK/KT family potassium transporter [Polyangiaceae bacterium]
MPDTASRPTASSERPRPGADPSPSSGSEGPGPSADSVASTNAASASSAGAPSSPNPSNGSPPEPRSSPRASSPGALRSLLPTAVPQPQAHAAPNSHAHGAHGNMTKVTLAALGIVFGDIGTSPLYSMRECFHLISPTRANVMGVLSLVFWSLVVVVSLKYVVYVLRADNKGEGGILALMALSSSTLKSSKWHLVLVSLGVFGAALLYGDGVITPAITVLGAVEGLSVAAPKLEFLVIPIAIAVLIGLFTIQRRGTAGIGALFGPVMLVWFGTLAVLGVINLHKDPAVISALLPHYAWDFLWRKGHIGFSVVGAVFLVVTGGEALYADLGHFGRAPIRRAWYGMVFPSLLLNYLGQGALLIHHPEAKADPFFELAPRWALYPLVALSTAAAVIASQALISGVYSLSHQGTMLGLLPRTTIRHTSAEERGQIYVPTVNWLLMLATIALVLVFRSSSNLAAAYGIAVTLTMVITTVLAFILVRKQWKWNLWLASGVTIGFLIPELTFTAANFTKFWHGGFFPLLVGALLFVMMTTWKRGREVLAQRFREQMLPLEDFFDLIRVEIPARVPGTAVFMTSSRDGTPPALLHNFLHNRVVHQHVVLLTITTEDAARVSERERYTTEELPQGFLRIVAHYGFMEQPDVPRLLGRAGVVGASLEGTTFFLGRETMIATARPGMARWRIHVFSFLSRNSQPATRFFCIPPDRVMEIGAQIEL